ncbi:DUF2007 domain-containing protein [Oligoflexaceae bacterium]|nr:DUF2007 domain-containing protein [Oligoflexaceae bacterium]
MKRVYEAENQIDAHIMKDALRRESIPVEIRGEALAGALGELPKFKINPTLWVPDEFESRALELVSNIQEGTQTPEFENFKDWLCPKCSESNEAPFAECWNCREPAPD